MIHHASSGIPFLANIAVLGFFVISGIVLTPSYDGRYGAFLIRRLVRLGPMYVLCVGAGYLISPHPWAEFFWMPAADIPAWSLCVEMAAMFAMPFFVWSKSNQGAASAVCAVAILTPINVVHFAGITCSAFVFGAMLSDTNWHNKFLEIPPIQYLGRISYPFYLSHWLVLTYLPTRLAVKITGSIAKPTC